MSLVGNQMPHSTLANRTAEQKTTQRPQPKVTSEGNTKQKPTR